MSMCARGVLSSQSSMAGHVFHRVIGFFTPDSDPPVCKMPGCNKQCYIENDGQVHDFCGRTHAREYKAMKEKKEAEKRQQTMREKRLKAVQHGQSSVGGHGGWPAGYSMAVTHYGTGPSCTRSGIPYGAYNVANQPTMITNHLDYGNMGHGPIRFYNRDEPFYEFTNFYPAPVVLDNETWPTTEHYFQAQKFIGTSYPKVIRNFERPRQAFDLSRNPTVSRWRRSDWEDIKISIMRKALLAKFTQHKHLRQLLLSTGDSMLIEHTPYDKFWGDGGDGNGENHLGMLLMEIRHDLKSLQASLRQEKGRAQVRVDPDSHREQMQTSESTEKDDQGSHSSSSSSCSMDYANAEAELTYCGQQQNSQHNHQVPANQSSQNNNLTRASLHPEVTENTGSPPREQQPATTTGGEGSPQGTPASAATLDSAPAQMQTGTVVGDLINLNETGPPKEDQNNPIMMGEMPQDLKEQPLLDLPIQCTDAASDTSSNVLPSSNEEEQMETDDPNDIH